MKENLKPKTKSTEPTIEVSSSILDLRARLKKQAEAITDFTTPSSYWGEFGAPVCPREFIESDRYFGNNTTKNCYAWVVDTIEEICSGEDFSPKYTTVAIMAGKGSGKSFLSGMLLTYLWYWYLSFKPGGFSAWLKKHGADFDDSQTVMFLGMAKHAKQAKDIIFNNVGKFINQVQIFRSRQWLPDPMITSQLEYNVKDPATGFKNRRLVTVPGNSSATFALGFHCFSSCTDEAAFFREKRKDPVEDLYNELHIRRQTRFGNNGVNVLISSPNIDGDFFSSFESKSDKDPLVYFKRVSYYDCKPTFIGSPRFEFKCKHERGDGTVEDIILHPPLELKPVYDTNPIQALKDFDAIPSLAGKPFYPDYMMLISKVNRTRKDPCPDLGMEKSETPNDIARRLADNNDFTSIPGASYVIHCDLAKGDMVAGQCGVGFAMVHKLIDEKMLYRVILDLSVRFKAPSNQEIQHKEILDLIKFLKVEKGFDIKIVSFDQSQSISMIQEINSWKLGITAKEQGVNYKEHSHMKHLVYSGQFDFFDDINLIYELKRLEDYGTSIDTSAFMDEADAAAGACFSSSAVEGDEDKKEVQKPRALNGVVVGRGGGSAIARIDHQTTNITPRKNYGSDFTPRYRQGF